MTQSLRVRHDIKKTRADNIKFNCKIEQLISEKERIRQWLNVHEYMISEATKTHYSAKT